MSFAKWVELITSICSLLLFILAVYTGLIQKEYAQASFMLLLVVVNRLFSFDEEKK